MGLLKKVLRERRRGRRDFGPPMGRPRMVPNIPEPIPPLKPFERFPFDDPRDDFMSIQNIENVGVPGITPVEPVIPTEIPMPITPVLPPQPPVAPPVVPFVPPPITPPSIPAPTPLKKLPIQSIREQQIFVPPRTIVDRELPREVLPPQTPVEIPIVEDDPIMRSLPVGDSVPFVPPTMPTSRDDFMSIGGPGGGFTDNRTFSPVDRTNILPPLDSIQPPPLPEDRYGTGKMFDPANLPEGYSFQDTIGSVRTAVSPRPGFVYAYGPDGDRIEVPSGEPGAEELRNQPPLSSILGNLGTRQPTTPAPTTPAAVADDVGAVPPTVTPADYRPQIDPVLAQQDTTEILSDPLLRALYFGTADQPGFINQLQQATQNVMGAELPSTQFDQSMTQQFFNPYEDRVVQQTIQDVMDFGEKQDIAARARDIQTGGLSAFGSRARLTADERREALGRGLAESLSDIRRSGFTEAQRAALGQFGDQYARQMGQINRPIDLLTSVGRSLPGYGAQQTTIESDYRLPVDPVSQGLGAAFSTYQAIKPPRQTATG